MSTPKGILVVKPLPGKTLGEDELRSLKTQLSYLLSEENPDEFILLSGCDVYYVGTQSPTTVEEELMSGFLSINEAREKKGLPAVPWGNVPLYRSGQYD